MKILVLHNRYRQAGGEDAVVASEVKLLRTHGVTVFEEEVQNYPDGEQSLLSQLQIGWESDWSARSHAHVLGLCEKVRPDIAHLHNFWMRWTPSVHAACKRARVRTVQTLHNFRLLCPNAAFLRNGRVCQDCLGKVPWRGILHRCYRDSFAASGLVTRMIMKNRRLQTWDREVDAFITLSQHSRKKFVDAGFPIEKLWVKPNFLEDHGEHHALPSESRTIVFAGRFAEEKGLDTLLRAWALIPERHLCRLQMIGDGPLRTQLQDLARGLGLTSQEVEWLGLRSATEVVRAMSQARAIALPSLCFENCPRTVIEAYCCGRPVIASRIGALNEFVHEDRTGLKADPGDPASLAEALGKVLRQPESADFWGAQARLEYLAKYTPVSNFRALQSIYDSTLGAPECSEQAAAPSETSLVVSPANASPVASKTKHSRRRNLADVLRRSS